MPLWSAVCTFPPKMMHGTKMDDDKLQVVLQTKVEMADLIEILFKNLASL